MKSLNVLRVMVTLLLHLSLFPKGMSQGLPPFQFQRPGMKDGLHLSTVSCLAPDKSGNLWLGTRRGIIRFDGIQSKVYKRYEDGDGLIRGYQVWNMALAPNGEMWFSTEAGLVYFDPKSMKIKRFESQKVKRAHRLAFDEKGNLLVSSQDTLRLVTPDKQVTNQTTLPGFPHPLGEDNAEIRSIFPDPNGKGLWVSTTRGLVHIRIENKKLIRIPETGVDRWQTGKKGVWIMTDNKQFWWLDRDQNSVSRIDPKTGTVLFTATAPSTMSVTKVTALAQDKEGNIWFASPLRKNFVYQGSSSSFLPLVYNPLKAGTFPSGRILDLFENKDGSIWMATEDGLVVHEPSRDWLTVLPVLNPADTSYYKNRIHSVKAQGQHWWLACTDGQLVRFNPVSGEKKIYTADRKLFPDLEESEPLPNVYTLHFYDGKWLVGTRSGVVFFDPVREKWWSDPRVQGDYWNHLIYALEPENDSIMWVKIHMMGTNRLNLKTLSWKHYGSLDDEAIVDGEKWGFFNIFKGPGGRMFIDDFLSLRIGVYDPVQDRFVVDKRLDPKMNKEGALTIHSTSNGKDKIWQVVSPFGIFELDYKTGKRRQCSPADSTEFGYLKGCFASRDGRIWIADQNQIGFLNPGSTKYSSLRVPFGSYETNYDTHFDQLPNGDILVNTYYDIALIKPDRIRTGFGSLKPQLSQLKVNGEPVFIDPKNHQSLTFNHLQNSLEFQFGMLTATPENLLFEYSLAKSRSFFSFTFGEEEDHTNGSAFTTQNGNRQFYQNLAGNQTVSMFSLSPGQYQLIYRIRSKDSAWMSEQQVFSFVIEPAFYQTAWFWTSIVCLFALLIYVYYRSKWRARDAVFALEARAMNLEKEKTIVQYESLKQQLNPHFLFNSLSSLGSLIRIDPKMAVTFLEAMSKSYRYILRSQEQELVPLRDELQFIQTFIQLQKVRFENALQFDIDVAEEEKHLKIVPVTLQNLVENAIKHNVMDDESPLCIRIFVDNGFLVVENNLQKKAIVEGSNKKGLNDLRSFYSYLDSRPIKIEETASHFRISIPLV